MDLRVEEVCFPRRLVSSSFQSRWDHFLNKKAMKLEDSMLHLGNHWLQQLKTKLLLCYHLVNCCHTYLPVSNERTRAETTRKLAIFRGSLQPAVNQAGIVVPMERMPVENSQICPSHVPKSEQALGNRIRRRSLKIMAAP